MVNAPPSFFASSLPARRLPRTFCATVSPPSQRPPPRRRASLGMSTIKEGLSSLVEVVVEVPKWSFVKRSQNGIIDFVSPLPCLFNYGSVPIIPAPDGDPLDAIILGKRLPLGHQGIVRVKGIIKFTDAGLVDNKLICTQRKSGNCSGDSGPEISEDLSVFDLLVLHSFFNVYAVGKNWLNIVQGKQNGPTSYGGYEIYK
ncbi:unnamed protein product [Sphagnum troendelagicum]|uniref:inorganic diphosphatase n=1 Tax=Sphagnum troendelagicum TaxID=128251 RepID=A0ABP0V3A9_9BRYO